MKIRNKKGAALIGAVVTACSLALFTGSASAAVISPVSTDVAIASDGIHVAIAPCIAVGTTTGSSLTVVIEGSAKAAGAVAVRVRCGVVQNGSVVASVQNALPGSVAATAGTRSIAVDEYSVCADVYALFVDGAEVESSTCPD